MRAETLRSENVHGRVGERAQEHAPSPGGNEAVYPWAAGQRSGFDPSEHDLRLVQRAVAQPRNALVVPRSCTAISADAATRISTTTS
jgi:hypothetical protein